jgi:hypothetical protein
METRMTDKHSEEDHQSLLAHRKLFQQRYNMLANTIKEMQLPNLI